MSVMLDLKLLRDEITASKQQLSTNLNTKGVETVSVEPLSQMANKVANISQTVQVVDNNQRWLDIGYTGEPSYITNGVTYAKLIYDNWNANEPNLMIKFLDDEKLVYMPLVDTSNATHMVRMFAGCTNLRCVPSLDVSSLKAGLSMFTYCTSLISTPDINWDAAKGYEMGGMFSWCTSLKTANMPNTSRCVDMENLFRFCTSLKTVNINTKSCLKYGYMFLGCESLTDLSIIDINSWRQPGLGPDGHIYLNYMFDGCKSLKTIKLRGKYWDGEGAFHTLDPWVKGMFDGLPETGILYYEPIGHELALAPITSELQRTRPKWTVEKTVF